MLPNLFTFEYEGDVSTSLNINDDKISTRAALIWDGHQFGTLFTFGDNKLFV